VCTKSGIFGEEGLQQICGVFGVAKRDKPFAFHVKASGEPIFDASGDAVDHDARSLIGG
jgi:hypothetical protein